MNSNTEGLCHFIMGKILGIESFVPQPTFLEDTNRPTWTAKKHLVYEAHNSLPLVCTFNLRKQPYTSMSKGTDDTLQTTLAAFWKKSLLSVVDRLLHLKFSVSVWSGALGLHWFQESHMFNNTLVSWLCFQDAIASSRSGQAGPGHALSAMFA
jgi:hypothetical protein